MNTTKRTLVTGILVAFTCVRSLGAPGDFDPSFNPPPWTHLSLGLVECIALQSDGQILLGGNLQWPGMEGIVRLNVDGSQDATFHVAVTNQSSYALVANIAVQANGKVLIVGDFTAVNGVARAS